ncbi:MAG: hypothetical protein ACTH2Q_09895 [Propionibacteriaceae bacterium]
MTRGGLRSAAVRRRLLLWSLPVLLLLLLFAGKSISMVAVNESGRDAYAAEDPGRAVDGFDRLHTLNLFQRWIAPFNSGTARTAAGDLAPARADLMLALERAPQPKKCLVAVNLAHTLEALGDAAQEAGRPEDAREFWTQATDVLTEYACDTDSEAGDESSETRERVEQKIEESQGEEGDEGEEPKEEPEPEPEDPQDSEQKEREVEQRNREAQQDRQSDRDFDRRDDQPDVDRPW